VSVSDQSSSTVPLHHQQPHHHLAAVAAAAAVSVRFNPPSQPTAANFVHPFSITNLMSFDAADRSDVQHHSNPARYSGQSAVPRYTGDGYQLVSNYVDHHQHQYVSPHYWNSYSTSSGLFHHSAAADRYQYYSASASAPCRS